MSPGQVIHIIPHAHVLDMSKYKNNCLLSLRHMKLEHPQLLSFGHKQSHAVPTVESASNKASVEVTILHVLEIPPMMDKPGNVVTGADPTVNCARDPKLSYLFSQLRDPGQHDLVGRKSST